MLPLAVTTSERVDPALEGRAREAALEVGAPFFPRSHKDTAARMLERVAALVIFESGKVALSDREGTLRFSPGLAHLRVKQIDRGVREDRLLTEAALREGDRVLDCTAGLCVDAQVAARLVGKTGRVVALEKSPGVFLLAKHGLRTLAPHPSGGPLEVRLADAADFLAASEDGAFDVVLLDPMFTRPRKSSAAFAVLRRHADHSPLTKAMLADAQRVARRAVVVKGSRYSQDFKALGLKPSPARPNATVLWATLPGLRRS